MKHKNTTFRRTEAAPTRDRPSFRRAEAAPTRDRPLFRRAEAAPTGDRPSFRHTEGAPTRGPRDWPDMVYGKNAVYEVLRAGKRRVHKILLAVGARHAVPEHDDIERARHAVSLQELIQQKNIPIEHVTRLELDRLTQGAIHQNVVAKVEPYPEYQLFEAFEETSKKKLVLMVDCVQDPQNFGTLCRSALAFGVREIVIPKDRSVTITPAVCKASSGAVEHLKIIFVTNLARSIEDFKKHGFWVYGASLDVGAQNLVPLPSVEPADKSAVVVGSEGQGLRRLVAESCDVLVKIPMAVDFDSLNVAQAGTVILYDFWGKMRSPS